VKAKRKAVTDVPANLAAFDPAGWGSVLDWVVARRAHFAPLAVSDPGRWVEASAESHRVMAAVLRRGELV
jgi:hypothetical protein